MYGQFHAHEPLLPGFIQSRLEEPPTQSLAAKIWNDPHGQAPTMSVRWKEMTAYVTPSHDMLFCGRHDMRVSALNHVENEIAGLRQGERFKHGQIFSLPRNDIESGVKTADMRLGDGDDLDFQGFG